MVPFIVLEESMDMASISHEIIVFGAGMIGKLAIYMLKLNGFHVKACFDNNPEKVGERLWKDVLCVLPKMIDNDIPIVVAVENMVLREEMHHQCVELGYKYICNIDALQLYQCIDELPDKEFLELQYFWRMGRLLDLENPKTYNEKLQWLKLYDRNPEYVRMVDKYEVKKYVADLIGEEYIIPTLGIWNSFEEIDFNRLPRQFVLKCTHDSGSVVTILDKNSIDYFAIKEMFDKALHSNYYEFGREWVYKDIKPRIIAEKYMVDESGMELKDYKFFCFNGVAKALFIASDRLDKNTETKFDFYDMKFKHLPLINGHPNSNKKLKKPLNFNTMKILAEKLSQNIPHVRVDFYNINGRIYFGEMTFSHWSGFTPFEPEKWDEIFGDWIKLNVCNKEKN